MRVRLKTVTLSVLLLVAYCCADDITFSTEGATRSTFTAFLQKLRDRLTRDGGKAFKFRVLPSEADVPRPSQRFFTIHLTNGRETVSIGVDAVNAYIVGYSEGTESYFFGDSPSAASSVLFPCTNRHTLRFNGSYPSLQHFAGENRANVQLGIFEMDNAILLLSSSSSTDRDLARSFIIIIQMVSEAARFQYIEGRVRTSIRNGDAFTPDAPMLSLENKWKPLSSGIQNADESGIFPQPVQLQHRNYSLFNVDSISNGLVSNVMVLLFICVRPSKQLILPVVDSTSGEICTVHEPTVWILGRDGLCVDVRDGKDNDGNPIQLWPCGQQQNQKWTLKSDSTIRSLNKCLTTYAYRTGSYIMIYNCETAVREATLWEVWPNGTIINPKSALVLSAEQSSSGTTLTLQTNLYAARQGWQTASLLETYVASIVGLNDLCMQMHGSCVWLDNCAMNEKDQSWAFFPDGTIRVNSDHNVCLTSDGHNSGDVLIIRECSGWANMRWVFLTDGSAAIVNPGAGLVMDVRQSDPSLHQIILYPHTGNPNQRWYTAP